jgi:hypothetical protein
MNRRIMMSSIGLGTAGVALSSVASAQQEKTTTAPSSSHSDHAKIAPMIDCARACAATAKHCLNELRQGSGDRNWYAVTFQATTACEDFCFLAARLEECENPLAAIGHQAAAEACKACADACDRQGKSTEVVTRCVEACRRCEEHCRSMAGMNASDRARTTTQTRGANTDASKIELPRRP